MKKELFIENSPFLTRLVVDDSLKESIAVKQGKNNTLIVLNIPTTILNRSNQNGRVYSTEEMQKALNDAEPLIKSKQLLCQASEHPEGSFVSPTHASHVVTKAYIKKNVSLEVEGEKGSWDVLFCDIEVLNTQEGQNLQALLLSGCSLGTSIRGLGDMQGDRVVNYEFLGFDIVSNPSSGTFTNMPIYEATLESLDERVLDEAIRYTVSTYASNTTHDLQQAIEFQNNAATNLQYGTITDIGTKMDQEIDPATGVEKIVGEVEVETSDDTSELRTAIDTAVKAFTNPNNINVTSVTIEKVDDDDMKKDSAEEQPENPLAEDALEEDNLEEAPLWGGIAKAKDWFANKMNNLNNVTPDAVWASINKDGYNFLKSCVDHGIDLKHMNKGGQNPLMYAAAKGMKNAVKALASDPKLINSQDKNGSTPLMYAVSYAQNGDDIAEILLNSGADTSITNNYNKTVFDYAQKKPEVLKVLQQTQTVNNFGTPTQAEQPKAQEPEVAQPAAPEMPRINLNPKKAAPKAEPVVDTPAQNAQPAEKPTDTTAAPNNVAGSRLNIIKSILGNNRIPLKIINAVDDKGFTALDNAVASGDQELVNWLKSQGANHSNKFVKQNKAPTESTITEDDDEVTVTVDDDKVVTDINGEKIEKDFKNKLSAKATAAAVATGNMNPDAIMPDNSDDSKLTIEEDEFDASSPVDFTATPTTPDNELPPVEDPLDPDANEADRNLDASEIQAMADKYAKNGDADKQLVDTLLSAVHQLEQQKALNQIKQNNQAFKTEPVESSDETAENVYDEPTAPSDDFVTEPKQAISDSDEEIIVELADLSYDVDPSSEMQEDMGEEYDNVLAALQDLPDTLEITIKASDISPDSDPIDTILKQANVQTGLPIKNARIADVRDAK